MLDRREALISRILAVLQSVEGIVVATRNVRHTNLEIMPAAIVFDTDEHLADHPDSGQWVPPRTPQLMTMRPEIYVIVAGKPSEVGPLLNGLRASIFSAMVQDTAIQGLVGANGRIVLDLVQTALAPGRQMSGEMKIVFAITYPVLLKDLLLEEEPVEDPTP